MDGPVHGRAGPALHPPLGGVLCLDLGGTIGLAVGLPSLRIPWIGFWELPRIGGEGARLSAFRHRLGEFLDRYQVAHMLLEAPLRAAAQNNDYAARQQYGLRAICYAEGYDMSVSVSEVDFMTVRSEVLGQSRFSKGGAKDAIMTWCRRRGIKVTNSHMADAALLFEWRRRGMNGVPPAAGPLWRDVDMTEEAT